MGTYEKLHLANNLEALNLLAKKNFDVKKFSFESTCSALSKLYKNIQLNVLDQEKTYILLVRYLTVYNHLKNTQSDKKFIDLRFGSEYDKVLMQYERTKKSLEERYAAKKKVVSDKPIIEEKETVLQDKPQRVFTDEFITCQQLFSALQKNIKMLLVDARPDHDFAQSRINHPNCINVPDQCITSGLSANALGKKLPPATQEIWELRESYSVIVLFDWNTSSDNFALTKLSKLRSALVDWDLNRNYNEPPVTLNGGYLELLQMYPTLCTNPHVYLFQKNNELDELLELDNIKYPTESDNKTLVMGAPESPIIAETSVEHEEITKEAFIEEIKEIAISRQNILIQLRYEENEKKKLTEFCNEETNINNIANLKTRISEVDNEINRLEELLHNLDKKKNVVKKKFKSSFDYELEDEKSTESFKEAEVYEEDPEKLKDIIDEERDRELKKARALKPKQETEVGSNNNIFQEPQRPVINRATKPATFSRALKPKVNGLEYMTCGLVGLRNIRNTCYMNTIIQCMRNIPLIMRFFCDGVYVNYNIRNPAAIIHETISLVRDLWSKNIKSIDPQEFYNKVCQLEGTYKLGNHEDCMEFFLFLLNLLSEDCSYDVILRSVPTPKQRAWYNQFEGKNSVFIDLFYHQIRITQQCTSCRQKTYKFEIESTFMLSVPERDFTLEELMNDYMADYIIPEYCCAKCKKPVNNQKEICYEPKIVVIHLKRYRQIRGNGSVNLKKIESKAHFPVKNFQLGNRLYHLNAIAMHSGDMNYGHYTAAALTQRGWYEFNDETVRPININEESVKIKACAFFYSMGDE